MPKFIQPTLDITEENRHLHLYNIELANSLANIFNTNIMDEPSSFVYNSNTKRVELHKNFDLHPEYSAVIAQQINWFLSFEEQTSSDNRDLFLVEYLNKFKSETLVMTEKNTLLKIFKDLDFEDYFGTTSSMFIEKKLNELLIV